MFRLFPDHWLEHLKPGEFKVGDVPHNEILLRWTAAIKAKWEKLKVYHTKNIVAASDAYVIAVNGCQLGAFPLNEGVSRYPYAVEAVYPLGPGALTIDKHGKIGNPFVTTRLAIQTAKGAPVPTSLFLDKRCEIVGRSLDRSEKSDLPLVVVHNHVASIPPRIFGSDAEEWVPVPDGPDAITLQRLHNNASSQPGK